MTHLPGLSQDDYQTLLEAARVAVKVVDQERQIEQLREQIVHQAEIDFTAPCARATDPDTSHDAAKDTTFRASAGRLLALRALRDHGPMNDFELAAITRRQQNSIGKRRGDCADAGLVEELVVDGVTVKRPAPSGSSAIVWALTTLGREYLMGVDVT